MLEPWERKLFNTAVVITLLIGTFFVWPIIASSFVYWGNIARNIINAFRMSNSHPKINLLLKAVGDAPIMKQKNWAIEGTHTIAWLTSFIKKYLNIDNSTSLFLFVNQSFSPSPDHTIYSLHQCFTTSEKLVIHYSTTNAWG